MMTVGGQLAYIFTRASLMNGLSGVTIYMFQLSATTIQLSYMTVIVVDQCLAVMTCWCSKLMAPNCGKKVT